MTGVLLERLWVHDAADLSSYVEVRVLEEQEAVQSAVTVKRRANGRFVASTSPGVLRQIPLGLKRISRDAYESLRDLSDEGRLVMVRLPRGRKLWGTIGSVTAVERRRVDELETVTFTLTEVTYDEEV